MDIYFEAINERLSSDQITVIGFTVLFFFLLKLALGAYQIFENVRLRKHHSAREKKRLELLKLKYEIAALKKQHGLDDISDEVDKNRSQQDLGVDRSVEEQEIVRGISNPSYAPWAWLLKVQGVSHILAKLIIELFSTVSLLTAIASIATVMIGIGLVVNGEDAPGVLLLIIVISIPISYLSFRMAFASTRQSKLLKRREILILLRDEAQ